MRLLILTENTRRGGLDTFLINLYNNLNESHDVTILCNRNHPGIVDLKSCCANLDIETYDTAPFSYANGSIFNKFFTKILVLKSLFLFMRNANYDDLLIVNGGIPGGLYCRLGAVLWVLSRRGRNKPIHNFHNLANTLPSQPVKRLFENSIDKLVDRYTREFIGVSSACALSLKARPKIRQKAGYIYNGIVFKESNFHIGEKFLNEIGVPENRPVILNMGTFEARKGHTFLLEAFCQVLKHHPKAVLVCVGDGSKEELDAVKAEIKDRELNGSVWILPFSKHAYHLLSVASVVAVPSQSFESFGLVAAEAQYNRVPVIATDCGGLPEVVQSGRTGIVVDRNSSLLFGNALITVLDRPDLAAKFGAAGRVHVMSKFSTHGMIQSYETKLFAKR
jgi:L-malate glycosyltransferase